MIPEFSDRLRQWQRTFGRHDLPWQGQGPYATWISEIMLQQTQVRTAIPYFQLFIDRFPNVTRLANAAADDVMRHWAGLGYYARARNLHLAAQQVRDHFGGKLPNTLEALMNLKGVGRSTAGAILALGFNERGVIQDGNVRRVLSRLFGIHGDLSKADKQRELWRLADRLTPQEGSAANRHAQAMMDLGALICTRHQPKCASCPFIDDCYAHKTSQVDILPEPKKVRQRPTEDWIILEIRNSQGQILLEQRPQSGIWGGLYSPPIESSLRALEDRLQIHDLLEADEIQSRPHAFSHFKVRLHHMRYRMEGRAPDGFSWYEIDGFQLGLPAPISALLRGE